MNAYSIHGADHLRQYEALYPVPYKNYTAPDLWVFFDDNVFFKYKKIITNLLIKWNNFIVIVLITFPILILKNYYQTIGIVKVNQIYGNNRWKSFVLFVIETFI